MAAEVAISSAVELLGNLIIQKIKFLRGVKGKAELLRDELRRMQSFLKDANKKQFEDERVRNWISEIRELAQDAQDTIEIFVLNVESGSFIEKFTSFPKRMYHRHRIGKEIETIREKLVSINASRESYGIRDLGEAEESALRFQVESLRRLCPWQEDEHLVGVEDDVKELLQESILCKEKRGLSVAVLEGMGGIGKSTLARKIYNHAAVVDGPFECRGWVVVSSEFTPQETIKQLMFEISGCDKQKLRELEESMKDKQYLLQKLKEMLYSQLEGKSYFIVLDDVWETQHLEALITAFPNQQDLGSLTYFLGIEVARCREGLLLSQHKYTTDLLARFEMSGAKPVTTPMSTSKHLSVSGDVDPTLYRSAIGGLQYLTLTRPDIAFAVNRLAQSMSRPTANDWTGVKRILRYLKNSIHHGLLLRTPKTLSLRAYSDSDFGGDLSHGKSTSAYIIFLDSAPISWRSRRQKGVARSSTEAEYRSLASTASEVCWLYQLFRELGVSLSAPPQLLCDNLGATRLALNPIMHSRMKHIAIDLHFVRDLASKGIFHVAYVNTLDQLADVLTKPLARTRFLQLRSKISVADGTSILRGRIREVSTRP